MALAVAATVGGRAAASTRYADAGGKVKAAAAAAAARCSKPTAACEVLDPGSSRYTTSSQCHGSSRSRYRSSSRSGSSSGRRHCSGSSPVAGGAAPRRAGHLLKLQQEQQQRRMNSSACATLFLSASCATHQGTAVREEIARRQAPGTAAQRACSLPPAGAAAPAAWAADRSPPTAALRRDAAAWSGKTTGLLPAAAAPAGEEEVTAAAAPWTGGRSTVSLAAKLRPAVVTVTPEAPTIPRSTATKTGLRRIQTPCQQISRLSSATEMQRACGISTSEVVQTADKKLLLQPLYFLLAHLRCTYTALPAGAPLGRTHKASVSTSFTNRVSAVATVLPSTKQQQRRLPPPHTAAAAACPLDATGTAAAPLRVTSRQRLSCSAAAAVRGTPPPVAAFGPAAAASWGFAPRLVVSPLLKFAAALRSSEAATGSLPAAVVARGARASLPTVWQCGAVMRRTAACASASAAAAAASAAAPPPGSTGGGSRAPGAAAASSKKTVAALPLGSLYSKTHEYVHLLLEFVGPTDVEAGAAATGERKGRGDAATGRSPRPRHCQLVGFVGLSAHAAEDLGEVVYCEYTRPLAAAAAAAAEAGGAEAAAQRPPQRGRADRDALAEEAREEEAAGAEQEKMWVRRGSPVCSLESVKSVAEVYSPVEGIVLAINPAATKEPALVWRDSEGDGWLVKLLLPLPAGKTSDGDDEICSAYALHLTDADLAAAAAAEATAARASLGAAPAAEPKLAAGAAAGGGPAAAEAAAASEAAEETYKFMQACRDCQRLQDALRGLRRRLMGPEQYTQFVEREKQAAGAET